MKETRKVGCRSQCRPHDTPPPRSIVDFIGYSVRGWSLKWERVCIDMLACYGRISSPLFTTSIIFLVGFAHSVDYLGTFFNICPSPPPYTPLSSGVDFAISCPPSTLRTVRVYYFLATRIQQLLASSTSVVYGLVFTNAVQIFLLRSASLGKKNFIPLFPSLAACSVRG